MPGPVEEPRVHVVDKRGGQSAETERVQPGRDEVPARIPEGILTPDPIDPVDILLAKTFNFIVQQPEFINLLALPKPVRKRIGQDFGRMLTRFPHFDKANMNG